jgi:hypothetical protein
MATRYFLEALLIHDTLGANRKSHDSAFSQPTWPISCRLQAETRQPHGRTSILSVYPRPIFGLPMKEYFYIMFIIKTFSLFTEAMKDGSSRGRL